MEAKKKWLHDETHVSIFFLSVSLSPHTHTHTHSHTDTHTHTHTHTHAHTDTQTHKHTHSHTDTHAHRHTHTHTQTHTHMHTHLLSLLQRIEISTCAVREYLLFPILSDANDKNIRLPLWPLRSRRALGSNGNEMKTKFPLTARLIFPLFRPYLRNRCCCCCYCCWEGVNGPLTTRRSLAGDWEDFWKFLEIFSKGISTFGETAQCRKLSKL